MERELILKSAESDAVVANASTLMGEREAGRFHIAAHADLLVSRCKHWAEIASTLNATSCASQRLRLYRRGKGSGTKRGCRAVTDRKRMAYLKGHCAAQPSAKSMEYMGDDDAIEVVRHPVLDLLRHPCPWMSGGDFTYLRFKAKDVAGNSYAFAYADGKAPTELYFLAPQYMRIKATEDSPIAQYVWSRNRTSYVEIEPEYMLHQRARPSLDTPWLGTSPIVAVFMALDIFEAAMTSEMARWINGGAPYWVAECAAGTDPKQREAVRDYLRSEFRGPQKAGNFLVTAGVKITNPGLGNKEMEYRGGMEDIRKMVYAAFDVPQSVMELNDANLASATSGNGQYARQCLLPRLNRDADGLTEGLLPMFGVSPGDMWFCYDNPVPEDRQSMVTQGVSLANAGVLTANELRAQDGYEPIEGGDTLRFNGMPVGGEQEDPNDEGGPDQEQAGEQGSEGETGVPEETDSGGGAKHHKCGCRECRTKDRNAPKLPKQPVSDLAKEIRAWFDEVKDGLRVELGGSLVILADAAAKLDAIVGPALADMFKRGMLQEAAKYKPDEHWNVVPVRAAEALSRHRATVIEQVMDTTLNGLRKTIQEGVEAGATISDLSVAVRDQIDETYSWRAENIARTETANALGAGRQAGLTELGIDTKEWLLAGGPCPMCEGFAAAMVGKKIPIDQPFMRAGESWVGTDGKTYTATRDIQHEPLHPSCRCAMVGVVEADS